MQVSEMKDVVRELMPRVKEAFGLTDWDINVIYTDEDPNAGKQVGTVEFTRSAQVHIKGEYMHASLVLFTQNIHSEERLRSDVVHEMVHVSQWMFFQYTNIVGNLLPQDMRNADEAAWTYAVERHVQEVMRWPSIKALYAMPKGPGRKKSAGKVGA